MCLRYVSEVALDAALADARNTPAVNSQRLFTREWSEANAAYPSERRALNS